MEKSIEKAIHFPDNVDKSLCTPKNPTKSKIVISSEIGITCDELGRFIAIPWAKKLDVKAPDKRKK
jgi:hypothetical protein